MANEIVSKFAVNENVLIDYNGVLYDGRILEVEESNGYFNYRVHYMGYKKSRYDEFVEEQVLLKKTPENEAKKKEIHEVLIQYGESTPIKTPNIDQTPKSQKRKNATPLCSPAKKKQKLISGTPIITQQCTEQKVTSKLLEFAQEFEQLIEVKNKDIKERDSTLEEVQVQLKKEQEAHRVAQTELTVLRQQQSNLQKIDTIDLTATDALRNLSITELNSLEIQLTQSLERLRKEQILRRNCSVCKIRSKSITFIPCGHLIYCNECSQDIVNCTICNVSIEKKILVCSV